MQPHIAQSSGRKDWRTSLPLVTGRQTNALVLYADPARLSLNVERRFVYVFILSSDGSSSLLWGKENSQRLPTKPALGAAYPAEITLRKQLLIGEPYGVDTYVLLTTANNISDTTVLEFDSVRSVSRNAESEDPLQNLLESVANPTRGARLVAPEDWSIHRLTVRSVAPQ